MRGRVFAYELKAGRRWGYVHDGPANASTGRRRQVFRRGFSRERDAHTALRQSLGRVEEGGHVDFSRTTMASYLRAWLEGLSAKPTTISNYRSCIEVHLVPTTAAGKSRPGIGGIPLQALTPEHLDALYRYLEREGRRDGQGLAPKSVRHVHTCVRKALQDAMQRGHVLRNVADLANPPSQRQVRGRGAQSVWGPTQLRSFLNAAQDDRLYAALLLLATTGMRRGEVAGLRWSTVDLDAARLQVRYTSTMVRGEVIDQDSAKTDAGERTIALGAGASQVLRDHRRSQIEERLRAGDLWTDSGRVFTDEIGQPMKPDVLLRRLRTYADAAGLPRITVHQLRHSYATAALRAGVPVEVLSKRLGHASVGITLDVYRHVQEGEDQAAAALAEGAILGIP